MKYFFIIITVMICMICQSYAFEQKTDTLSKIESSVLGIEYSDQKLEQRLNRLEEYLYGSTQKGTPKIRLSKIIETTKYNLIEEEPQNIANEEQDYEIENPDNSVDYPILDDVENKLGLQKNKSNNLDTRLSTIEKKLFQTNYAKEDYFTRVERIKSKLYDGKSLAYSSEFDNFGLSNEKIESMPDPTELRNNIFNSGSSTLKYKLSLLEQRLLKNTFNDETNNDRLARLENVVFDTQFYNENETERMDRLESALKAKKSAPKYDSNKFQQGLNTAMQIGAMVLMVLAFIL